MSNLSKRIVVISTLAIAISVLIIYFSYKIYQKSLFNEDSFFSKNYTTSEIDFFVDIAFMRPGLIRKWESDIKVEIDTTNGITDADIFEIDKVIEIIAPLIKPISIYRVQSNGNLIVHLNLLQRAKNNFIGYTTCTDLTKSKTIYNAEIFVLKHYNSIIMHEFLHAIGIDHPEKEYPFYTVMGVNTYVVLEAQEVGSKYPDYGIVLNTWDEYDALYDKSYNNMSEQEKKAVKMLYSSDFKSGLTKKYFLNRLKKQK